MFLSQIKDKSNCYKNILIDTLKTFNENGTLNSYVYFDKTGRDSGLSKHWNPDGKLNTVNFSYYTLDSIHTTITTYYRAINEFVTKIIVTNELGDMQVIYNFDNAFDIAEDMVSEHKENEMKEKKAKRKHKKSRFNNKENFPKRVFQLGQQP